MFNFSKIKLVIRNIRNEIKYKIVFVFNFELRKTKVRANLPENNTKSKK